jgi:hypothetical protein
VSDPLPCLCMLTRRPSALRPESSAWMQGAKKRAWPSARSILAWPAARSEEPKHELLAARRALFFCACACVGMP